MNNGKHNLPCIITILIASLLAFNAIADEQVTSIVEPRATRRGSDFEVRIERTDNIFNIIWHEPLSDTKANANQPPFSIVTGPYLGWLTATEAVIGWEVIAQANPMPNFSCNSNYDMEKIKMRWANLNDLTPDTEYNYRLTSKDGNYKGKEFSFRTMPAPGTRKLRFDIIGDTQRATSSHVKENLALAQLMTEDKVPLVLHLGDLVYGGAGYDFNGRKSWFRMLRIIDCYRSSAFMAIALGNHDVTPEAYSWGPDYFGDIPAVQSNSAGKAKPPYYYSFDVANVHFIALCTEARRTDKNGDVSDQMLFDTFTYNQQLAWLAEDLKNAKAEWIIVFSHQPLHTVGGYSAHVSFQKDVGALLDQYKVPLMISAHDHSYQRTWRIGNLDRKKRDDGTVQVISGGASNFFSGGSRDWNIHYMRTNHYMRVAVDGDAITFKAVGVEGEIIDHWRLKKNGQPEDLPVN